MPFTGYFHTIIHRCGQSPGTAVAVARCAGPARVLDLRPIQDAGPEGDYRHRPEATPDRCLGGEFDPVELDKYPHKVTLGVVTALC